MSLVRITRAAPSSGGGTTTTEEIVSTDLTIISETGSGERRRFQPAVVTSIEWDNDSKMSSITDQCGRREVRNRGSKNPKITISGIITDTPSTRAEASQEVTNLTVEALKNLRNSTTLKLLSDIHSGTVTIRNTSIAQNNTLFGVDVGNGTQEAFEFQIQLQVPQ